MNTVPLRKEFSDLLVQLNALSASEKQILLTFLTCSAPLPSDTSSIHASADDAPSNGSAPTAPPEVVGDSVSVINLTSPDHYWNVAFLQGETFNLNYFEESQEKSTALTNDDEPTYLSPPAPSSLSTQEAHTESDPSVVIIGGGDPLPDADSSEPKRDLRTTLHCPLCQLEFPTRIEWEQHLYSGHTSPIAPVCWRCQGLFDNHAVLLAHECFDWCRSNLPGQTLLSNNAPSTYTSFHETPLGLHSAGSGSPVDRIYLRRRCGLCYKSSVVFTTYHSFQNHKTSAHSTDHVKSCSPNSRRTVCFLPEADDSVTDETSSNRFLHPQSEASLHSMIRHLLHHFWYLQNRNLKPPAAPDDSQCCPPEKVSADQLLGEGCAETEEGSLHINIRRPSDLRNFRRPPYRPTFWRAPYTRMMHTRKLRKSSHKWPPTNPYHKHYVAKIGSFTCLCCPAVFRLASRLRAHYLFKHGHIPESLGGLTPTAEEAALLRKRPLDDSAGCSSNFSDSSDTSVESTRRVNMRRTSRQAIRCTRKLGPMIRFPQALRAGQPLGSASSSQTDDACTREIPSKQRSTDSFPSSESHKRIRKTRSKTNSVDSTELPNPSGDAPSHTNAEQVSHSEACWVLRPSQGGTQASSSVYECKLCQRVYSRLFNLQRHHKQAHRGVFRFYCGYCDFRTDDRGALDEHLARHLRLKQFACEFCNARFIVQRELSDHLAFKHSSERRHQCPVCAQTFKTAGTLSRHKKVHVGHKRIACSLCSLTFTRPSNLKRHLHRCHRASRMNGLNSGEAVATGKRSGARPRRITLATAYVTKETTVVEAPCKTTSHSESNNDVSMSSADLDVSTSVLSVSSSIESESHVTAENGVLGATALVTTEANMIPLSTIFVPYITAEVDASVATSLAISEAISLKIGDDQSATLGSTGDYVSARSAADLESNVSETISIAQKTVLPSITLASLFPIRITNHFPSTESTVSQNGWSASPDAPSEAQSKPPTDSSLPYGCYAASVNVTGVLPPTKLASSSDEDTLSHIWRPIECDIRSIQPSVVTMPFHLIAPLHGKAETQPTSCVLAENAPSNESLEVSQLLSNANAIDRVSSVRDSPRFPSPVSGSFSPAHRPHHPASASATPPPPASQELKSAFVSFATDSVIEQGSSGSGTFVPNEDLNPVSNLLPSSSSSSVGSEPIVFHPHLYSDSNRPIPVQFIMCDSHTGCPQFLSPMWNCTTTLESLPPYSTSMCLSPSTSSHQSVADSCSNFSVGYLIGQPTSCGPIASEDHVTSSAICSTSSSADSNTVYFGFDPSGSS